MVGVRRGKVRSGDQGGQEYVLKLGSAYVYVEMGMMGVCVGVGYGKLSGLVLQLWEVKEREVEGIDIVMEIILLIVVIMMRTGGIGEGTGLRVSL